jgi:hypothetical protein
MLRFILNITGNRFIPLNYKGWCAVAQTKPVRSKDEPLTADDIEECYIYQGVQPSNIPVDTISSDITANDSAQLSCTFKFDGAPLTSAEPGVTNKVIELLTGMHTMGSGASNDSNSTYNRFWSQGTGAATTQWGTQEGEVGTAVDPDNTASPSKVTV